MSKEEVVKVAVDWWIGKLSGVPQWDNASLGAEEDLMVSLLASLKGLPKEEDAPKMRKFACDLYDLLMAEDTDSYYGVMLSTDYGPEGLLYRASESSGIDTMRFPFKTRMVVKTDEVKVASGYGADYVVIYPTA